LELHPFYGLLIPLTFVDLVSVCVCIFCCCHLHPALPCTRSLLRGYYIFSFLRWALNFMSLVLVLVGHTILQPNYKKACCYGLDYLEGDELGGNCDAHHARSTRGFEICDVDFLSDSHKSWYFCIFYRVCILRLIPFL